MQIFSDFLNILTFQSSYNINLVLVGSILLGFSAGLIGAYLQLFKQSLLGDTVAHAAFPGIVLAFLFSYFFLDGSKSYLLLLSGGLTTSLLGILALNFLSNFKRVSHESALGIILSVFFGVGILLLSYAQELPKAAAAGLQHFIYGNIAAMRWADLEMMLVISVLVLGFVLILKKELLLIAFDRSFSLSTGLSVPLIDRLFMLILLLLSIIAFQAVGILLIVALLIIPAATSRLCTNSLNKYLFFSAIFAAMSCYLGAAFSALSANLPTGALIVLFLSALFVVSLVFSPKVGLLKLSEPNVN